MDEKEIIRLKDFTYFFMNGSKKCMPLLLHSKEDRIIKKRRNGVVLYTKSKLPKLVEHKNIQMHRHLCTAAYR